MNGIAVPVKLRRPTLLVLSLMALSTVGAAGVVAEDHGSLNVRIVINPEGGATRITREDLARIYLGKKTLWEGGTRITPAMLDEEAPAMQPLMEHALQKSVEQYRAYWKRLLFSGGGSAPRTFKNSAQVIEFVVRQPGAIGVVELGTTDPRVKVVEVTN